MLEAFLGLPYEIVIPDTLFEEELLKFSAAEKALLLDGGMKVVGLPGEGVLRAQEVASQFSALSIHDCFALTLAERNPGCILLTGDALLRSVADGNGIEVHGVLWAIEEMHKASTATVAQIVEALQLFESNPVIFRLPLRDLRVFIKRYKSSIE